MRPLKFMLGAIILILGLGQLTGTATAAPVPVTSPTLSSTHAYVGATLSVTPGTYAPPGAVTSDEWDRCSSALTCTSTGVTGTSYTVSGADVGDSLEVVETATAPDSSTVQQDSGQTSPVPGPPINIRAPVIAGSPPPGVGNTLEATQGVWTSGPPGAIVITDTWLSCKGSGCRAVSGPTTAPTTRYKLTRSDIGHTIEVMETATNGGTPAAAPVFSQATSPVTNAPADATPPTISGTTVQGYTLAAAPGTWKNQPTSYAYQWLDCLGVQCTAIAGATGASYTLAAGDVGATIVVSVSGVNRVGAAAAADSARVGPVLATSSTSLTSAPAAPVTNQSVTLAATVTAQAANGGPAGSIAFLDGGRTIGGCAAQPVTPTGQSVTVLCQTSFAAESAQLAAVFTPATGSIVLGSTSPVQALIVSRGATTTALAASAQVVVDAATTYTATVAPATDPGGPIGPSGSVDFLQGGNLIAGCAARPVIGVNATCTVTNSGTGVRSISARYDGDSNFAGSSSPAVAVAVTAGLTNHGLSVKGTITATMQWTFQYAPKYTRVINLVINGVPTGATVQLRCRGHSCPFAQRSRTQDKPRSCKVKGKGRRRRSCPTPGTINLTPAFRGHRLLPGSQITIEIHRPRFIGKYYSFTVRPRRPPRVRIACLAVAGTRPGVGC